MPIYAKPERRFRTTDAKRVRVLMVDEKEIHRCEVTTRH
jgi:hypothetical protein